MDKMIEKVKDALLRHVGEAEKDCEGCAYAGQRFCVDRVGEDAIDVIKLLEEQNKELMKANDRLLEQLKAARELGQNGVPPMPCKVGDPLWFVFENDGVIRVEKTECAAVLWDGTEWLVSENATDGYPLDEGGMFLSIEAAVKKAEEMLRNGNDA